MSRVGELVIHHVPYLRRYARALTGSQARGDKYVAATLEALLAEADEAQVAHNPRLALFRMFHDVWQRLAMPVPTEQRGEADDERSSVKRALAALPRRERQVYLLNRLERFTPPDIATVLRIQKAEVEQLLTAAESDLEDVPSARILIVEDDPVISMANARLVEDMGHTVAGTASTKAEAIALNASQSPDLLLVDIRLQGGDNGIDAVEEIIKSSSAPVIFVTGHPEDLLTGRKREPAFVLTKPFDPEMLKAVISQALSFSTTTTPDQPPRYAPEHLRQ
jgi:CheY-like chemotaxis protein/DNA-directed RNA polymerase specialized sigma24 family protein